MKITNSKTLSIESSLDIVRDSLGIVVRDRDETKSNALGIYIPRFMFAVKKPDGPFKAFNETESLDSSIIVNTKNKKIGGSSVGIQNYLTLPGNNVPNYWLPRYVKGERLKVTFLDQDIKSAHYLPFGANETFKRKVDRQRIFVMAKEDEDELDSDENSYFIELNSRDKKVIFHTSEANGENNPFTLTFDTAAGTFNFKDILDSPREFLWDVNADELKCVTEGGTTWSLCKAKASLVCEELDIKASNKINMETAEFTLKADKGTFNITDETHNNSNYTDNGDNIKLLASAECVTKSADSAPWLPNVIAVCPFGTPHGGPGAGISMLKGS